MVRTKSKICCFYLIRIVVIKYSYVTRRNYIVVGWGRIAFDIRYVCININFNRPPLKDKKGIKTRFHLFIRSLQLRRLTKRDGWSIMYLLKEITYILYSFITPQGVINHGISSSIPPRINGNSA